jgi:hypothetical protein
VTQESTSVLSRPLIAVAVGLAVLLAVGVAALGLVLGTGEPEETSSDRTGPLALVTVDAPAAGSPECTSLVEKLPVGLPSGQDMLPRREIATPAPVGAVAWGDARHDPVVLRCGLNRPAELSPTSELRVISDVTWLRVEGSGSATWFVVDRPAYVALTVPDDAGTGPLQDVSTTIRDLLPKGAVKTTP